MVAAYVIHVIDESLLGGSFVENVQQHWWPQYTWKKFFWFNTGYFVIMIGSVVAYDLRGGSWLISSARMGCRTLVQWFLASLVDHSLPRILARSGEQHSHRDGLLFHSQLPTTRRNHSLTNFMDRSVPWIARCRFSGFLYSAGKRQDRASQAVKCKRKALHQAASALRRCCISSSETFSLCVEIVHVLPNGSRTRPSREPKNISIMGLSIWAPASTAFANTASESATNIWASKVCSGQPSVDSPKFTRGSPNFNSQCTTFPSGVDKRRISSAPKARL